MTNDESHSDVLRSIRVTSPEPRLTALAEDHSFAEELNDRLGFTGFLDAHSTPAVMSLVATKPLGLFQPILELSDEGGSQSYRPVTLTFAEFERGLHPEEEGQSSRRRPSTSRESTGVDRAGTDQSRETAETVVEQTRFVPREQETSQTERRPVTEREPSSGERDSPSTERRSQDDSGSKRTGTREGASSSADAADAGTTAGTSQQRSPLSTRQSDVTRRRARDAGSRPFSPRIRERSRPSPTVAGHRSLPVMLSHPEEQSSHDTPHLQVADDRRQTAGTENAAGTRQQGVPLDVRQPAVPEPEAQAGAGSQESPEPSVPERQTPPDPARPEPSEPDSVEAPEPDIAEASEPDTDAVPEPDTDRALEADSGEVPEPDISEASEPDSGEVPEPDTRDTVDSDVADASELSEPEVREPPATGIEASPDSSTSESVQTPDTQTRPQVSGVGQTGWTAGVDQWSPRSGSSSERSLGTTQLEQLVLQRQPATVSGAGDSGQTVQSTGSQSGTRETSSPRMVYSEPGIESEPQTQQSTGQGQTQPSSGRGQTQPSSGRGQTRPSTGQGQTQPSTGQDRSSSESRHSESATVETGSEDRQAVPPSQPSTASRSLHPSQPSTGASPTTHEPRDSQPVRAGTLTPVEPPRVTASSPTVARHADFSTAADGQQAQPTSAGTSGADVFPKPPGLEHLSRPTPTEPSDEAAATGGVQPDRTTGGRETAQTGTSDGVSPKSGSAQPPQEPTASDIAASAESDLSRQTTQTGADVFPKPPGLRHLSPPAPVEPPAVDARDASGSTQQQVSGRDSTASADDSPVPQPPGLTHRSPPAPVETATETSPDELALADVQRTADSAGASRTSTPGGGIAGTGGQGSATPQLPGLTHVSTESTAVGETADSASAGRGRPGGEAQRTGAQRTGVGTDVEPQFPGLTHRSLPAPVEAATGGARNESTSAALQRAADSTQSPRTRSGGETAGTGGASAPRLPGLTHASPVPTAAQERSASAAVGDTSVPTDPATADTATSTAAEPVPESGSPTSSGPARARDSPTLPMLQPFELGFEQPASGQTQGGQRSDVGLQGTGTEPGGQEWVGTGSAEAEWDGVETGADDWVGTDTDDWFDSDLTLASSQMRGDDAQKRSSRTQASGTQPQTPGQRDAQREAQKQARERAQAQREAREQAQNEAQEQAQNEAREQAQKAAQEREQAQREAQEQAQKQARTQSSGRRSLVGPPPTLAVQRMQATADSSAVSDQQSPDLSAVTQPLVPLSEGSQQGLEARGPSLEPVQTEPADIGGQDAVSRTGASGTASSPGERGASSTGDTGSGAGVDLPDLVSPIGRSADLSQSASAGQADHSTVPVTTTGKTGTTPNLTGPTPQIDRPTLAVQRDISAPDGHADQSAASDAGTPRSEVTEEAAAGDQTPSASSWTADLPGLMVSDPGGDTDSLPHSRKTLKTSHGDVSTEMPSLALQEPEVDSGESQPEPDRQEIRKLRRELRKASQKADRAERRAARRKQKDRHDRERERESRRERMRRQSDASRSSLTEDVSKVADRVRSSGPDGSSPPEGRPSSELYPDLTVKTLAPKIDATRREETSADRDITHREPTQRGPERRTERAESRRVSSSDVPGRPADVDRMVEQLRREMERKMRIERERRGL